MIDATPLTELHDIVPAPAAEWWPLAPGWYAVVVVVLVLLLASLIGGSRYISRRRVQRAAMRHLQHPLGDCQKITLALKQACLGYVPRRRIAALQGMQWVEFLLAPLPAKQQQQWRQFLIDATVVSYRQQKDQSTADEYQRFARYWIHYALPHRVITNGGSHHV